MQKKKGFIREVANDKAYLPPNEQKRHAAGITVQRRRNPMSNPLQFVRRAAAILLAFGLIACLLPATATCAERIRIIVDTDIQNEMDDQHALAYTLFNSHVFEVEGVTTNSKQEREVQSFYHEALRIVHLCASAAPVHIGAHMTYDRIKGDINKSTFDGHAAVNFIIQRAHASDPDGRPLYVMTFGKTTNLALALLKDPTIAPKIRAVTLITRFPASLEPSANWTVSESNHLDDRYAVAALLENAALELHIVPWPSHVPSGEPTLNPGYQEIYDIMPGLGPKVAPIVYNDHGDHKPHIQPDNGQTFTCFGDYSVALFKNLEYMITTRYNKGKPPELTRRRDLLDVAAPMVLKNPAYAIATVMGAPRWDGTPGWTGSTNNEPGKWILNPDNPRKVTVWNRLHLKHSLVMADYWNTMRNPVIDPPPSGATAASAEKIRIIMDTDARAEVDDQHAIAYMLFSGNHFEVEGITTNRGSNVGAIEAYFTEGVNLAKMCASIVPVLKGPNGNYSQIKGNINNSTFDGSDAVNFIIERAHAPSGHPLIIYACGNLTNVALALLKDPTIAPKIEIWWLGTEWPKNHACNNHAGDLDAVDALLANPQNVAFNIIPWPHEIWTNHEEIYEKMSGKGPIVSPGVPGRWGGSFTCFGDYSVELFQKGVWSGQKRRSLLDAFGLAVLKNKSWYTPFALGAPSFVRTDPGADEKHKYPGYWVANDNNPRRVTFWMDGQMTPVMADFFNTFDNYVLAGSTSHAQEASQIHHREHNLLLDATCSGNMDSFNVGLRRFNSGDCLPQYLVYDFKKQVFTDFSRWDNHGYKRISVNADIHEYGIGRGQTLGVVPESQAAYWMAEWPAPVSANFITLTGSRPNEPSQANTAWKIELRSNNTWRVHAQGVGGWYDRGEYFWGGRGQSPIQFDALRVKLYSKDGSSGLSNIHFSAQEDKAWMVAFLPAIDAQIAVKQQVPRAGQVVEFAGNQVFGTVQSWQWDFGDGRSATGQTVSNTFADAGTYDVTFTLSGAGQTAQIVERVTIHPAIEAQITPLSGSVLEGDAVAFDASNSYGPNGTYSWDFDDGTTATGQQVTKSFAAAGIYRVTLTISNSTGSNSCAALMRVHTPATVNVPQVLMDTDVEGDDQKMISYAMFSEVDLLAVNPVHHGGHEPGMEELNYNNILKLIDLAQRSGLPAARVPRVFRGADQTLIPPYGGNWTDTEPMVTEASSSILEAARGASPDNPVWVVVGGPITNVGTAILQARREGWESQFRERIRISWLGGSFESTSVDSWNGRRDRWAAHIVAQSGIDFLIVPEVVGCRLRWNGRNENFPATPLGDYLKSTISPNRMSCWYDITALAAVISIQANDGNWFWNVRNVTAGDRYTIPGYRLVETTATTSVRLIHEINTNAMKNDFFDTLNGKPTALKPMRQNR